MDERWEMKTSDGALWIDSEQSGHINVYIHDVAEGVNARVTPDDACRIALELLRRVGVFDHTTIRDLRARYAPSTSYG